MNAHAAAEHSGVLITTMRMQKFQICDSYEIANIIAFFLELKIFRKQINFVSTLKL